MRWFTDVLHKYCKVNNLIPEWIAGSEDAEPTTISDVLDPRHGNAVELTCWVLTLTLAFITIATFLRDHLSRLITSSIVTSKSHIPKKKEVC